MAEKSLIDSTPSRSRRYMPASVEAIGRREGSPLFKDAVISTCSMLYNVSGCSAGASDRSASAANSVFMRQK